MAKLQRSGTKPILPILWGVFLALSAVSVHAEPESPILPQQPETERFINEIVRPRVTDNPDEMNPFAREKAREEDVKEFIEQTLPKTKFETKEKVQEFIKRPPLPKRDRGVLQGEVDQLWARVQSFLLDDPDRFKRWADISPITTGCVCMCGIPGLAWRPAAMFEYWFPTTLVEVTEHPLETAFFSSDKIDRIMEQLTNPAFSPYGPQSREQLHQGWTKLGIGRIRETTNTYLGTKIPDLQPDFNRRPSLDEDIYEALQRLENIKLADGSNPAIAVDVRHRNALNLLQGHIYTEFRAIPLKQEITQALRGRHPEVCHWEPKYGKDNPVDPDYGTSPVSGSVNATSTRLGTSSVVASDFPSGAYDIVRNPMAGMYLMGRDRLRQPGGADAGFEYDAAQKGGWMEFFGQSFFNGGSIGGMYLGLKDEPLRCSKINMGMKTADLASEPRINRANATEGRQKVMSPEDLMKGVWEKETISDPVQMARSGCAQGNLGPWAEMRNYVKQSYHTTAAQVAAIRALKLAYYLHPHDSYDWCKQNKRLSPLDQWGLFWCFKEAGYHYDFSPFPYADSHAEHPKSQEVVWGTDVFGGSFNRVADKLQWFEGGTMDPSGVPVSAQRDPLAFEEEKPQGYQEEEPGQPNLQDEVSYAPAGDKSPLEREILDDKSEVRGPHHIAIAWRFFRSCPQFFEFTYDGKTYGWKSPHDGSTCCTPCYCLPSCCCPLEKKL